MSGYKPLFPCHKPYTWGFSPNPPPPPKSFVTTHAETRPGRHVKVCWDCYFIRTANFNSRRWVTIPSAARFVAQRETLDTCGSRHALRLLEELLDSPSLRDSTASRLSHVHTWCFRGAWILPSLDRGCFVALWRCESHEHWCCSLSIESKNLHRT